ncbi:hypothetical protein MCHI_003997 [Candidatus Magnetoovum chiemensis]|nr:hypothetical protein MCHI_003997 [Candidatus Magnetoovum chiemensis]
MPIARKGAKLNCCFLRNLITVQRSSSMINAIRTSLIRCRIAVLPG